MELIQLDFFKTPEESEMEALRGEIERLNKSLDKQRKALFARSNEVGKMCYEMNARLEIIERNICRGK